MTYELEIPEKLKKVFEKLKKKDKVRAEILKRRRKEREKIWTFRNEYFL